MWQRCTNPSKQGYYRYGGRCITVCEEWKDFRVFLADMGRAPASDYEIDRKRNGEGYSKDNCRWVTKAVNAANKG